MGPYQRFILPRLLDRDMQWDGHEKDRAEVLRTATGTVLEIGFGSGLNMRAYPPIDKLYALDPSPGLFAIARGRANEAAFPVEFLEASAERIPLPGHSVDTVVSTWTLCSIPDVRKALAEVRRVLKPGGTFIYIEHGLSPAKQRAFFQRIVTPFSRAFCGNCHLDRNIGRELASAGFSSLSLDAHEEPGKPLFFAYSGTARA